MKIDGIGKTNRMAHSGAKKRDRMRHQFYTEKMDLLFDQILDLSSRRRLSKGDTIVTKEVIAHDQVIINDMKPLVTLLGTMIHEADEKEISVKSVIRSLYEKVHLFVQG
jgi:hypothetical protein